MKTEPKKNCWEYMRCERQPGGKLFDADGGCPVATDRSSDGINGGMNGGRFCWAMGGTFCFGEVRGSHARKIQGCMDCDFFWMVADGEDDFIISTNSLCDTNRKNRMASTGETSVSSPTSPDQ